MYVGAALAFSSAALVYPLPAPLAGAEGALHGRLESIEDAAELGLGGRRPCSPTATLTLAFAGPTDARLR